MKLRYFPRNIWNPRIKVVAKRASRTTNPPAPFRSLWKLSVYCFCRSNVILNVLNKSFYYNFLWCSMSWVWNKLNDSNFAHKFKFINDLFINDFRHRFSNEIHITKTTYLIIIILLGSSSEYTLIQIILYKLQAISIS